MREQRDESVPWLRLSLSSVLVTAMAAFVLIGTLGTTLFLSSAFQSHAEDEAKRVLASSAETILEKTEALFGPARRLIEHLRSIPPASVLGQGSQPDSDQFTRFFRTIDVVPASNSQIAAVYMGFPDGSFVLTNRSTPSLRLLAGMPDGTDSRFIRFTRSIVESAPRDFWSWIEDDKWQTVSRPAMDYDPRSRPWYTLAAKSSKPKWTGVYKSVGVDRLTITLSSRLEHASGELGAVAAVDLRLDDLIRFIKNRRIGSNGLAFLAGPGGALLAHPDLDLSKLTERTSLGPTLFDVAAKGSADLQVFETLSKMNHSGSVLVPSQSGMLIAAAMPLDADLGMDYTLYVAAPLSDFTAAADAAFRNAALIAIGFVCVVVLLGIFIARAVATRINKAVSSLEDIARLEGSKPPAFNSSWLTEIEALNRTIRFLFSTLRSFRRYVPADVVRRLNELKQPLELGGERREVTVLLTDIEGFTGLSEAEQHEELVAGLADYFDLVCGSISRHGGTVDKFIGDAVMAFWGAPTHDPEQGANATAAVEDLIATLEQFNNTRRANGRAQFKTRFALHRGYAFVGNIGSRERFGYTAIGDVVNTTARLEEVARELDVTALATSSVVRSAGKRDRFRSRGQMQLRGKREPVEVFEFGPAKVEPAVHLSVVG